MRFTVIGHSTLYVETSGGTLLVDPWFSGSCYWRSWWHFPPTGDIEPGWLTPDFVYVSHDHFDHFHYPTLRRLDRNARLLVPRFGIDFMVGEFHRLGFQDVRELTHGRVYDLAPDVRVASYQYGFDDTLLVVADHDHVLFDVNDCKTRGRPLRRIVDEFGHPDVMLKSHSFAQGYPNCYDAADPADLALVSRRTFLDDFIGTVDEVQPRYAVPFASMVAFLHPESRHANRFLVTPPEVRAAYEAARPSSATEVVVMAPGDRWDSTAGFSLDPTDWYRDRDRHLDELADIAAPAIARSAHEEQARVLTFADFEAFFRRFLHALPPLTGRLAIRRPIVFAVDGDDEPFWVLDARHRTVRRAAEIPAGTASVIRVAPGVLADAMANQIVHYVHISMRFHDHLEAGGVGDDLAFWGLLTIWELGYLPVHRLARPRMLAAAWRRRAELTQAARGALRRGGSLTDRMSAQLASPDDDPSGVVS